ncbi:hypothetical protein SEA_MEDIUMFRY_45 [Arthrobacter phage MediumFry]|nr:hypothetical protein SEA_MEDIUMFRY_45 [Arthrobacter phage MediumFry]
MRKAGVFVGGMVTGMVVLPLAVRFVPPVRNAAVVIAAIDMSISFLDADRRDAARKLAERFIDIMNNMDKRDAAKETEEETTQEAGK